MTANSAADITRHASAAAYPSSSPRTANNSRNCSCDALDTITPR
ncbi:hypothetical protein HEB94_000004 [Actinopolymorpha pittospori]|uniref:Uncharacterized protein n=1 Tax=Actinopolymorpha pittospori TaxID=648752 RepID=A0A927MM20_9ACTN|nr:hypothetical protein [Actinopolymorpha pittospori]MBE1603156.1 hypothetical protein [Actinopolymorpha pittospori]